KRSHIPEPTGSSSSLAKAWQRSRRPASVSDSALFGAMLEHALAVVGAPPVDGDGLQHAADAEGLGGDADVQVDAVMSQ
ncbi:MAG TPA: hypothetical protein PKH05_19035, partial [Nitrospira sp.]|nr:hypothetical protein [Nitrospira sp.]